MTYLTTKDNPWDPFKHWDEWLRYDIEKGYQTCEKIDKLSPMSDILPTTITSEILEKAYDQLINLGAYHKEGNFDEYIKVTKT